MYYKKSNSRILLYLILISISLLMFSYSVVNALPSKDEIVKKEVTVKEPNKVNIQVPQDKPVKHILLIMIDGMELETYNKLNLPNLKDLSSTGIWTNRAISSVFPPNIQSITENILTGRDRLKEDKIKKATNLIEILKSSKKKTAFIDSTNGNLGELINSTDILVSMPNTKSKEVIDRAIEVLEQKDPYLLGITMRDPILNKIENRKKESYNNYLVNLDNQLGRLIYKLTEMGVYDNTLTIIVGTNNFRLNSNNLKKEDINNLLIIRGPGIKNDSKVSVIKVKNIMPTINYLFNGNVNTEVEGKVLWDIIQKQGYTKEYLISKRINDLNDEQIEDYFDLLLMKQTEKELLIKQKVVKSEKTQVQNIINKKNKEINKLILNLKIIKGVSLFLIAILIIGYLVEYYILRKKFLLF